jgi:uncharacterized membrane protein YphA (DoxX/SURF4 family)
MQIKDTKQNWTLNVIARVFVGLVFIFSSFVKGVDPLGTAFKITDYLTAWQFGGLSFEWLEPAAPFLSMLLITLEFLVGVMLLTGSFRRFTAWLLALMMLFFTCTTLYDAISNKVNDCGCFGDAIKLTNWQTFWKNIILDIPTIWIVLTCNLRRKKRTERDTLVATFAIVLMVIFGLFNINNEPCIDFRPWKVGNQMVDMDENLKVKSYLTYRNKTTGETQEFLSEDLMKKMEDPAWEESWEWESSRVEDPHEIKADGFAMLDMEMNDHAQELIISDHYLMIATLYDLEKIDERAITSLQRMNEFCNENDIQLVILSSVLPEKIQDFLHAQHLDDLEYYFADATAIKTILRSNPGYILLKEGKVIGKWHYRKARGVADVTLN